MELQKMSTTGFQKVLVISHNNYFFIGSCVVISLFHMEKIWCTSGLFLSFSWSPKCVFHVFIHWHFMLWIYCI